jgi:sialate O-acetylesterase
VLPAFKEGNALNMVVAGKNIITLTNLAMGEVWVCAGPNDMDMGLKSVDNGAQAVVSANHPDIRLFRVAYNSYVLPVGDLLPAARGRWVSHCRHFLCCAFRTDIINVGTIH